MLNKERRFLSILSLFCIVSTINCTNNVTNIQSMNKAVLSKVNISGKVEFPNFKIKATINDVAPKATVSLISTEGDSSQNTTLVTGLTDTNGQFSLNSTSYLITGKIYVLEASKRIGGAGNNLLSLRTILKWNGNSFDSITSPGIYINTKTTALSIMSSLGQISAANTIGKMPIVNGSLPVADIKDSNNNILVSAASINSIKALVDDSFTANIDPVASIIFSNGNYSLKSGNNTNQNNSALMGCIGEPGGTCVPAIPSSSDISGCIGDPQSCASPPPTPAMNAGIDFSPTSNPNGVWSYGSYASNSYSFSLLGNHQNTYYENGTKTLQQWYANTWTPNTNYEGGAIFHNLLDQSITLENTVTIGAKAFDMYGGRNGTKSVVRWTAPVAKTYTIQATFTGIRVNGTKTDVHVIKNSVTPLLNGDINGSNTVVYNATLAINQNETLDFSVGDGGDDIFNDDTNFNVIITPVN